MIAKKNTDILIQEFSSELRLTLFLRKQGIYHIQLEDNAVYTIDSFKFSQDFRLRNSQFSPDLAVFEFGKFSSVDTETREIASQREASPFIAEAYITSNLAQRLLVRHYARILRAKGVNVQMFDNYASAKTWLLSLKKQR